MRTKELCIFLTAVTLWRSAGAQSPACQGVFDRILDPQHLTLNTWLPQQQRISFLKIMENISPPDATPGAVIAAKTRTSPNYYYHWVRDAALVMDVVVKQNGSKAAGMQKKIDDYVDFSEKLQELNPPSGLGEPKFEVNATVFSDPWGRPQNDSPALRAVGLMHIHQQQKSINLKLMPAMIRKDLDYVATHWMDPSFDLWEEVLGTHFYTLMVQRRALHEGAIFMQQQGKMALAHFYEQQSLAIESEISKKFWYKSDNFIGATVEQTGGMGGKTSNLDIAVVLGMLHGTPETGAMHGLFQFSDPRFLQTLQRIEKTFADLYLINKQASVPGTAIGRYPEDMFSGPDRSGGNPWVLTTLAMAEAYYRVAAELKKTGSTDWQDAFSHGDQFLARVQYHTPQDGSLNEQMRRDTGYMTSVHDLTWSYAALMSAAAAREQLLH